MFKEEAKWVEDALSLIQPLPQNNKVANLGSSTAYFREIIQPHIQLHLIKPLMENGWQILNVDLKEDKGVDEIADCTKTEFGIKYANMFGLTICTNMLEHVLDISLVVQNLFDVTVNNGYILLTVPYKYKKHLDPIDNMFRPMPEEIANLFPDNSVKIIEKNIIIIQDKEYYKEKKSRFPLWGKRDLIAYQLGIKHKVSGILIKIEK